MQGSGVCLFLRLALWLAAANVFAQPDVFAQQAQAPARTAEDDGPTVTFGSTTVLPAGLKGAVYILREDSLRFLPDFDKLKPAGYIYTNRLNIPTRQFSEGFPGISEQAEWFAIDYRGRFWVKNPGRYKFSLTSDDGARLYIDGKLLLDDDGVHAATTITGAVELAPRLHTIRVTYFQGPKYELALVLAVAAPGDKWRIFDMSRYVPGPGDLTEEEAGRLAEEEREDLLRQQIQSASTSEEKQAVQMLFDKTRKHDFDFRAAAFAFRNDASGTQYAMAFELPASSLKDSMDPATKDHKLNFYVFSAVKDSAGRIIDKFRLDTPYKIPDAQFAMMRNTSFTFTKPFHLAPGDYTLETVVFDHEGKSSSLTVVPIERAGAPEGPGLSTPVLIQRVQPVKGQPDENDPFVLEGKRLTPLLATDIAADAKPQVYFVAYPDKTNPAAVTMKVTFLVDGKKVAEQSAPLPAPNAVGAIPMTIGAAAAPGQCELRITALQGDKSVTRSLIYSVAGKRATP